MIYSATSGGVSGGRLLLVELAIQLYRIIFVKTERRDILIFAIFASDFLSCHVFNPCKSTYEKDSYSDSFDAACCLRCSVFCRSSGKLLQYTDRQKGRRAENRHIQYRAQFHPCVLLQRIASVFRQDGCLS